MTPPRHFLFAFAIFCLPLTLARGMRYRCLVIQQELSHATTVVRPSRERRCATKIGPGEPVGAHISRFRFATRKPVLGFRKSDIRSGSVPIGRAEAEASKSTTAQAL